MSVDSVNGAEQQARFLARKKKEVQDEENALELEAARAKRTRLREGAAQKEKTDKELVDISKAGEKQVELLRKLNSDRVISLNENTQKNYAVLAESTAQEIRRLEEGSLKAIDDHRKGTMEKVLNVATQGEDPFYRLKSLDPVLSEGEKEYVIRIPVSPAEAQNLFVTGENQSVKISLARRFQDQLKNPEQSRTTKTSSYQSVVETLAVPGPIDSKGIRREYAEGMLSIFVPKAGLAAEKLATKNDGVVSKESNGP